MKVLSTLAMKGVLETVPTRAEIEFHATQWLLQQIAEGAAVDVALLTEEGIDQLERERRIVPGTRLALGSSGVGLAVKQGAPRPDISTLDRFKAALVAARSVGHSKQGASGLYFAGLLERLGLADKLKKRVIVEKGPVAARVASGEVELGVQLLCELAPVAGIDIVGPFPAEVQSTTSFAAAVVRDGAEARAFMEFLGSPQVIAAMEKNLLTPAPRLQRAPR